MNPETKEFLYFVIATLFAGVPVAVIALQLLFKNSVLKKIGSVMVFVTATTWILGRSSSFLGISHLLWIMPIAIISVVVSMYFFHKILAKPINDVKNKAKKLANGNLDIEFEERELERNDEIGEMNSALFQMIISLNEIFKDVQEVATSINNSGKNLNNGSQQMSQLAAEQAASAQEVSASMEQMAASIRQNAENAEKAGKLAKKTVVKSEVSNKNVLQTTQALLQIVKKIDIISDIAFQTDILSLNASIEASKAGTQGKGFNVVAQQIRKLADKSKDAAQQIEKLSTSSINIANRTVRISKQVVPDIKKTTDLVIQISESSLEQDAGANQVNNAVQELNSATQKFAAVSEELAVNSEELVRLGIFLNEKIALFHKS